MKDTFTREEVVNILVSALIFSSSNGNQGLSSVKGNNFGEQAERIIQANESIIGTDKSIISVMGRFKD